MRTFLRVMKALSDPNRVKIIKTLQRGPLCVCEIRAVLDIAQPTVSNHLKVLEDADLVRNRRDGPWAIYSLADGKSSPYCASLLGNLMHWLDDDPEIIKIVETLPSIQKENICKR